MSDICHSTLKVYGDERFAEYIRTIVEVTFGPCLRDENNPYLDSERGNPPAAVVLIDSAEVPPVQLVGELSSKLPELSFTLVYTMPSRDRRGSCTYKSGQLTGEWKENLPEQVISDEDQDPVATDMGYGVDSEAEETVEEPSESKDSGSVGQARFSADGEVSGPHAQESSSCWHSNASELCLVNGIYHRAIANDRDLHSRERDDVWEEFHYYNERCKTLSPKNRIHLEHLQLSYESEERRARACMMLSKALDHLVMPGCVEILSADEWAVLERVRPICTKLRRYVREELIDVKVTRVSEPVPF
jgi:hypothetical protein